MGKKSERLQYFFQGSRYSSKDSKCNVQHLLKYWEVIMETRTLDTFTAVTDWQCSVELSRKYRNKEPNRKN